MRTIIAAAAVLSALTGCASIINGSTQAITIESVPNGASFDVTNRAGDKVHAGTTPLTVTLPRGAGYMRPELYTVTLKKEGFATRTVMLTSSVSGWYIGNVLFGGLIGLLAVDPATGAMYTFPESVSGTLDANGAKSSARPGSLTIVSTESLTPRQREEARLIVAGE